MFNQEEVVMKQAISVFVAGAVSTLLACGAYAAEAKISDSVVKVGILTDMSGLYSDVGGQGAVVAAEMAKEDFGGKVLGQPIEIVSSDHQNKADIASNKAREWFDTQKVDVIAELLNSSVGLAVQGVGKEKGKITINSGAASSRLTGADCSPTGIHWTYDTYALANGTGNAVLKQGGDTWFFLTADYAFGHSLEKDTTAVVLANGGKVLGSVKHPLNNADFSSFLLQAQGSKAKVIGMANAGGDTQNTIKQADEFGITKGGQSLAGLLVFLTDVHAVGLEKAQGLYLTTGFYWDLNDETRKWSDRFFQRHKKMPTMVQAGVYSSLMHYLKSVQAAGTDDASAVIAKMRATPINDFFARNGVLREDGRMVHDMYLAQVKKPAESKRAWDYYKILTTIPVEKAFRSLAQSECPLIKK
jgi:branched-chain amino acid transport system substrate-binding protein